MPLQFSDPLDYLLDYLLDVRICPSRSGPDLSLRLIYISEFRC